MKASFILAWVLSLLVAVAFGFLWMDWNRSCQLKQRVLAAKTPEEQVSAFNAIHSALRGYRVRPLVPEERERIARREASWDTATDVEIYLHYGITVRTRILAPGKTGMLFRE
jgi:hypothetical protein